ncbi:MAG: hypothetical protein CMG59_01590 [Candidatus Marinimicrobia bacterium]|nr:hypothetical protein [Candidatus Neomarinimicrobiota bacterium]
MCSDYIAVIDFDSNNVRVSYAKAITERITTELIKVNKYVVVERTKVDELLSEQKFQNSGCVNISCAVELGNILGARYIVVGTISKVGKTFSLDARLVDIESSESIKSANYTTRGIVDDLLVYGVPSLVSQLINDNSTVELTVNSEKDSKNDLSGYLHYYKFMLDINPEYDISLNSNKNNYYPQSGLSIAYEFSKQNGFGLGLQYQFSRALDSETDFGFNSIYFVYNYSVEEIGAGFSINYGLSDLSIYNNGEVVESSSYDRGDFFSISIRYQLSDLMLLEIGSSNFSCKDSVSLASHDYYRSYIGLTFTLN